jgi:septal ring factor EnvC (AmiA/AmiB activator)
MSIKNKDQTEIVSMWVTPETAKLVEEAESPETKEKILADAAKNIKGIMQNEVDMLDDEVIKYKGMLADFKQKFRQVKQEQLGQLEDIYHDYEKELSQIKDKMAKLAEAVEPVAKQTAELNTNLQKLKSYDLERLLELLESIDRAYSGESKHVMDHLFKTYKREDNATT